jgi:hypothetical protein
LILSLSDYSEQHAELQAESFFGEDFQNHLVTFLSYLTFWQDVLEHCRSSDVRHTLIDHFQILFLQQLLYVTRAYHSRLSLANINVDILRCWSPRTPMVAPQSRC